MTRRHRFLTAGTAAIAIVAVVAVPASPAQSQTTQPSDPPPPESAPAQPTPGPAAPRDAGGGSGDAGAASTANGAPVPPKYASAIPSIPRTPANNTTELLRELEQLRSLGISVDQAAAIGMGRFPVAGKASFVDDWWFPRYVPRFHLHVGTDIFAARGTPVRAPVDGRVRITNGKIGGLSVYVHMDDGTYFYMAHLGGIAKGVVEGQRIRTGQIVGYVGASGNARGGAPHVHFEIHPRGGGPINPKPYLDKFIADARSQVPALVDYLRNVVATRGQQAMRAEVAAHVPAPKARLSLLEALEHEAAPPRGIWWKSLIVAWLVTRPLGFVTAVTDWDPPDVLGLVLLAVAWAATWYLWRRRAGRGDAARKGTLLSPMQRITGAFALAVLLSSVSNETEERSTRAQPRWVRRVARVFTVARYAMWALLFAVTLGALVSRSWWVGLVGVLAICWRLGIKSLIRQNEGEVERWQKRRLGDSPDGRS